MERVDGPVVAAGFRVAVAPAGAPLTARFTVPENPFSPFTMIIDTPFVPLIRDMAAGVAVREKSVMATVTMVVRVRSPLVPVMVRE